MVIIGAHTSLTSTCCPSTNLISGVARDLAFVFMCLPDEMSLQGKRLSDQVIGELSATQPKRSLRGCSREAICMSNVNFIKVAQFWRQKL